MTRAVHRSYKLVYVLVSTPRNTDQLRQSCFEFIAKDDVDAVQKTRDHFTKAIDGQRYFWITSLVETTNKQERRISIPENIPQRRLAETTPSPVYAA